MARVSIRNRCASLFLSYISPLPQKKSSRVWRRLHFLHDYLSNVIHALYDCDVYIVGLHSNSPCRRSPQGATVGSTFA